VSERALPWDAKMPTDPGPPQGVRWLPVVVICAIGIVTIIGLGFWEPARPATVVQEVAVTPATSTAQLPTPTSIPESGSANTTAAVSAPSVWVHNAANVGGLAAGVTRYLTEFGYRTLPPADASIEAPSSVLYHRSGFEQAATTLAQTLAISPELRMLPEQGITAASGANLPEADLVLLVGANDAPTIKAIR